MAYQRRTFLGQSAAFALSAPLLTAVSTKADTSVASDDGELLVRNTPQTIEADGKLRLEFGDELMVMNRGLQPYMLCTKYGTLIVQAQTPDKPAPTPRMHYPYAMPTNVSRDMGKTWTNIPLKPGENGLNLEGGAVQLASGRIVALDTYVTPGKTPGKGVGQLYVSDDDWRTLEGPIDVEFNLPGIDFYATKDDGGHPHDAERVHRRIIALPNGDLLTTVYGTMKGDNTPSTYRPTMMKTRVMLVRSTDEGRSWDLVSTVAVDPAVGTEGFNEPVIARVSGGKHPGRLICFIRTGRDLYETTSDDEGNTWSQPRPRIFAGLDIHRTELWADMFRRTKGASGKLLDENNPDELKGAVVDPDLVELRSGILVAAFGVRVPQKACWPHAQHHWNGNYLAFSRDQGDTWSNVVRLTSGVPTTHYMAIAETPEDNKLFVAYDYGFWGRNPRYIYGRTASVEPQAG
ncbi:sialidase family protein [Lacipirellula parvula]|uniref:Sialidase domain-containing protein n=1 Tax=Lacipirellula parvula TaxID=2650471 RepID=A0A5K7XA92_9BACT|nr:sialidase family protein [Lacipirellula parvula]BBO32837.1 hypothetical protein PLANPX_2449 [Lacipirellula parvula]